MKVPESEWTWFGRPGHFICGEWCHFHLCTLVGGYLVSTVGEYVHPRHNLTNEKEWYEWRRDNWPGEDIGYNRKYETMVFIAGPTDCPPDGEQLCKCGVPSLLDSTELEILPANDGGVATANHMLLCHKYAEMDEPKQGD